MRLIRRFGHQPTGPLLAVGGALIGVVLLGTLAVAEQGLTRDLHEAERDLAGLDAVLTEQTSRMLQGTDLLLTALANTLVEQGIDSPAAFNAKLATPDVQRSLAMRMSALPQLDALALIATDSHVVNLARRRPAPRTAPQDQDFFAALSGTKPPQHAIGTPIRADQTGGAAVELGKRVQTRQGQLVGLVLGSISMDYFQKLYAAVATSPGMSIALWREDGVLLASYPPRPEPTSDKLVRIRLAMARIPRPNGQLVLPSVILPNGQNSIVVLRHSDEYPVLVSVSETRRLALADWWHDTVLLLVAGLACAGAIGILLWAILRQFRAYEAVQQAVAAQQEAEAQLRQVQKMEAIGQLTSGIAHDFNNLLMSIGGNLEFLERDMTDSTQMARLATITQATDQAARLTRQLLAFARKQILLPRSFNLNHIVTGMIDLLRSALGGMVRIELDLAPKCWAAFADPAQIEHVVLNLAINARDAMPDGGVLTIATANISATPDRDGAAMEFRAADFVRLTVRDTGFGMDEAVAARAFDPFFTTKPVGAGSGLGLAQVYGIAHQSGGTAKLESVPGHGTSVHVLLPRGDAAIGCAAEAATDDGAAEAATHPPAPEAWESPAPGTPILVVDDERMICETIAAKLEECGYRTHQAADGTAALALLEAGEPYAALVLDFALPEHNGAAIAAYARRQRPDLPVIFMTGYADPVPLRGERWIMQKPFRMEALLKMLHGALQASKRHDVMHHGSAE